MTRRTWLRPAFSTILLPLILISTITTVFASYIQHPAIDLEQLEQIGIAGPYGGVSLYTDTRQLTQIPPNTASALSFSNNTFELLAHSSANGSIYTACTLTNSNYLYIGGDFLQFGPTNVSNIAAIDLNTGTVSALANGIDGPVYTLYCDESSNSVYAGGRFMAPVAPAPQYSESLSYFGGGVAVWKDDLWHGLPWKGFNGPVNAIAENGATGTILFGGRFDTSADGQNYYAPSSQPVSLASPAVISAQNSGTVNSDPQSIVCPETLDEDPWLVLDDTAGSWQAAFPYSITPSLIRLSNTHQDGRGTKNFSVISIPSNTAFNFSYIDPITRKRSQCSTDCSLTDDPSVEYQDFQVRDTTLSSGIRIEISSWYGSGAGLSSVEIFQSEIFVYAVDGLNGKACATSMDYTQRSLISTEGSWASDQVSGSYVHLLSSSFSASQSSSVSATFKPYLPESGRYEVYLYAPACSSGCAQRSQIDVTTYPTSEGSSVKKYVDLSTADGQSILVYTGGIEATTTEFQPYVTVTVASNATTPASGNSSISLQAVQFIKQASNTTLASVLEFKYDATEQKIANTTLGGSYSSLADNIPYASTVNALEASDGNVYIGGSFSSASGANTTYHNIVRYDSSTERLAALQGTGLNGEISAFLRKDADLYVGGSFTGLAATGDTSRLNNIVRYSINSDKWISLGGGVNGPVSAIHLSGDSQNVIVSGTHSVALNQAEATSGNATAGNAWWSLGNNSWTLDAPFISGRVSKALQITNGTEQSTVFVGDVKAAQRDQARGFSFMNENTDLSPFPVYPAVSNSTPYSITAGTFWSDEQHGNTSATIIGGQFEIDNEIQNVAIYENESWSSIGASWEGSITMMAVNRGYLYIGGHMNQTHNNTQTGLVVYDLVNRTFIPVPELHTHDSSPSHVHKVGHGSTDGNMIIAGNFSSAGSLSCSGICVLDTANHQWNYLGDRSLAGEALDFTYTGSKLIVAGNLQLSGAAVPIAEYNYDNNQWSTFASSLSDDGLPGNSTAVSYDGQSKKTFIAGQVETGAYLRVWDGQQFTVPDGELGPESIIRQLAVLPLKESGGSNLMGNDKAVLLATGFLNLGDLGNLSSALYNGSQWIPYLTVASENGSTDALQSVFFKSYYPHLNPDSYLPAPIVVLVSVASALGIVFVVVLFAMGVLFAKRRREAKVNPAANPATYYGKPPRRPESLLAMLNSSDAMAPTASAGGAAFGGAAMFEATKDRSMSDNAYETHALPSSNMMNTGSTRPEMTETPSSGFNTTAALGGIAAATAAANSRGINNDQSIQTVQQQQQSYFDTDQQQQHQPQMETYNNISGRENTADASGLAGIGAAAMGGATARGADSRNSYNPFRSSAVGVAVSDDCPPANNNSNNAQYASRTPTGPESSAFLNVGAPVAGTAAAAATQVRWTNAPVVEPATAAIVGPVSMASVLPAPSETDNNDSANAVRWTNVPADGPATAVVGPVSMYSTASNLVPDRDSASNFRWTNAGGDADAAMATAFIAPVAAGSNRESEMRDTTQQYQQALRNMPADPSATATVESDDDPSRVRWTNYTTNSVQGVAALRPVTAISMYSDVSSVYGPSQDHSGGSGNNSNNSNSNDDVFGPVRPSLLADFSSDPDIVRWTTAPNSDTAKATAIVADLPQAGVTNSTLIDTSGNDNRNSGGSNSSRLAMRQYEAGLDLASLGEMEDNEDKYTGIMTNERSMSNDGSNNVAVATAEAASDARAMGTGIGAAAGATIATVASSPSNKDQSTPVDNTHDNNPKEEDPGTVDSTNMFKTSSFRWSETPSLPAIDTNFNIGADGADNSKNHALSPLSQSPGEPPMRWKETHTGSPIEGHAPQVTEASAATVTITGPDGNEIKDNADITNDNMKDEAAELAAAAAAASASGSGAKNIPPTGALDGRAASKRMVQDYFSSREPAQAKESDDKPKYHKDFQAAMNAAMENNRGDLPCSEDHPHLYYAKFDFNAREHGELGFDKGDPIIVVDRSDDIWWMGYKDNGDAGPMQGVFPSNYVERASTL
ncbi:cortical protein marker for cell polarity-domain-containing protein [Zychaea mexicana]|uniref:cortical protein marker for cell polarity-domain-containing protein n=1 Tax=Zychaea mexicana TaxID=64656 RepID=UPI0022FEAA62|nr:cortical protein marker for cell polarity-domain-containing protein [Zychaea mexicana]KAI9498129.1 cortical protein marker for cell polarity-domain-containing protein [Zychaea mexicana]